jgi:predicted transcriptional regulator
LPVIGWTIHDAPHEQEAGMSEKPDNIIEPAILLELTTKIVSAYASHAKLSASELVEAIGSVSRALGQIGAAGSEPVKAELNPAVSIKKSVMPDYIVCLEDGKKLKMLKRHLMSTYNMTPEQYREKWDLPKDYPMVAPNYARIRSELAKKIGLGRPVAPAAPVVPPPPPAPVIAEVPVAKKTRGRKKAAPAA